MRSGSFFKVYQVARRAVSQQEESEFLCFKETPLGIITLLGCCSRLAH